MKKAHAGHAYSFIEKHHGNGHSLAIETERSADTMKIRRVKATTFWGVFLNNGYTCCFWSRDRDECKQWMAAQ